MPSSFASRPSNFTNEPSPSTRSIEWQEQIAGEDGFLRRCTCCSFGGSQESKGINIEGIARGAISMSNVYLANAMIHLACKQAGGLDPTDTYCINGDLKVYGMKPATLITNIAIIASILSAFFMPLFGAIIDFTPHRKIVGVGTAICLAVISGVQAATTEKTWFAMAILQAIIWMIYQVQVLAMYSYFPEIANDVGYKRMNSYTSTWSLSQFASQASFNAVIIIVVHVFELNTVHASMFCQGMTSLFCAIFFSWAWLLLGKRPRRHVVPKGKSILFAGFAQNWKTFKNIWRNYKMGLRWFLISTIFGQAAASAVASTAVVFLNGNLGLSAVQIGVFFEITLLTVLIGTKIAMFATKYTNPNISLILSELGICLSIIIGVFWVQNARNKNLTYIWGFVIGIFLGWFYPTENLFFSLCLPRGQEAELAGFFVYCRQILGWFPPLIFTIMVQNDINMKWALTAVACTFLIAIFFLCLCGPWESIMEEAKTTTIDIFPEANGECDDEKPTTFENTIASNMNEDNADDNPDNNDQSR